uniref:Uncharacterized protein n=1 Tax=Plectus sambesii TaxID=2011161 RepID=A0A914X540_9BILA
MDDTASSADSMEADSRIRQRLDACRQGMRQLDALRNKHQRLMQDMRVRLGLPTTPKDVDGDANISSERSPERKTLIEQHDSLLRCTSPAPSTADFSSSISHRSSLSMDSGCVSVVSDLLNATHLPMSYSAYRKLSMEERRKQLMSEDEGCVVDDNRPLL